MRRVSALLLVLVLLGGTIAYACPPKEEIVAFNVNSLKYHCLTCSSALACTRSCIKIPRSEARKRGGVACKHCGGTCGS